MIQRIQSVFLLLSALVFGALFMVPFAISDKPTVQFLSDTVFNIMDHPALIALTAIGIVLSLVAIFMYKNRTLQQRFGYFIIIVAILLPVYAFLLFNQATQQAASDVHIEDQAGLYLPCVAIVFAALANRFIKKDDKLVKSMDRLR